MMSADSSEATRQDATSAGKPGLLHDWRVHMALVTALALVPRMIYLAQIRSWQFFSYPILDSRVQWKWAGILLERNLIGNLEVTGKAPLYAYWLAFNQWMFQQSGVMGPGTQSLLSAHLLQLTLGAVTCGLTYLLGRRVFGATEGFLGGLLLAAYGPGIYRDGQLLDTALATFLATAFVLTFMGALDRPEARGRWLSAGLLLGLLGLTRPNLLLLGATTIVLMAVWLRGSLGAKRLAAAMGVFALGVVLPILPITARNYVLLHRLVPISATGGINLYTGNNPEADGYSPIPSGIAWERTWYEARKAGVMGVGDHDSYWRRRAMEFFRDHPGLAAALFLKKVYLYWNAYEIPNNVSYDWGLRHSSLLRAMPLTFAVVGPLGLLGLVMGGGRSRRAWVLTLFVATQVVAVAAFFVAARYRMPAVTALCVFAGFGLAQLGRLIARRRIGALVAALGLLTVFAAVVNADPYGLRRRQAANRDYYYLGQSYLLANDQESAKKAFRREIERHPDDADAYALLGDAEVATGDTGEAAKHYRAALEVAPDFALTGAKLANVYLAEGWPPEQVEPILRRAVEAQPGHVFGLSALVRVDLALHHEAQAEEDLRALERWLGRVSASDTRAPEMYNASRLAVSEAEQAGVEVPELLRRLFP